MKYLKITNYDINDLSKFYEMSEDQLMEKSINQILAMQEDMKKQKTSNKILQREKDAEYARITKKYLEVYPLLSKYWDDTDIIASCAKHISIDDIVEEKCVPTEQINGNPEECKRFGPKSEYVRTSVESVRQYTKKGEELLYGKDMMCHVYRVPHRYQGTCHGKVVLDLLYNTYPELKKFDFNAYAYHDYNDNYEIYPKFNIYTPFDALLNRDVNTIIKRNMEYAKSYNSGIWTPEKIEKRLASDEVKQYFHVIENLKPLKIK